jgi:[ribosomal protein S18]-alanine N-acetyltransferase
MFVIETMCEKHARSILRWKYESPYDFYHNDETDEALNRANEWKLPFGG